MADLGVLLQYVEKVKGRLLAQRDTFAESLELLVKQWGAMDKLALPLAEYQVPQLDSQVAPYTVLASDASPLELSRHRAVELKAVSLARVFTDYTSATEKIERQILDLEKDEVSSLSDPLLELEYAVGGAVRPDLILLDGSLIRWQWEQLLEKKKKDLVGRYVELLLGSYAAQSPVFAVIDHSQGRDIVDAMAKLSGEGYLNIVDEDLFAEVLEVGAFSPVFKADAPILLLDSRYRVGFVYYRTAVGVLRIEFLYEEQFADIVWSRFADQVLKGRGFPFMIARAHDCCVVRQRDKYLLEQSLMKFGHMSQKERMKRLG